MEGDYLIEGMLDFIKTWQERKLEENMLPTTQLLIEELEEALNTKVL